MTNDPILNTKLDSIKNNSFFQNNHQFKNNQFIFTMMADSFWHLENSKIRNNLFFMPTILTIDQIKQYIDNNIKEVIKIASANIIEYNMEYDLNISDKGIQKLEYKLKNEQNLLLEKTGYIKNIKGISKKTPYYPKIKFNRKHIEYFLNFINKTSQSIDEYLSKTIYNNPEVYNSRKYQEKLKEAIKIKDYTEEYTAEVELSNGLKVLGIRENSINNNYYQQKIKDKWIKIPNTKYQVELALKNFTKSLIYNEFKKNPNIAKRIYQYIEIQKDGESLEELIRLMHKIKEILPILKAEKVDIVDFINPIRKTEYIEDELKEIEIFHQTKQLMNSILSNKNRFLLGKEEPVKMEKYYSFFKNNEKMKLISLTNYKYFKELVGLRITQSELENTIGSKLSRYKNSHEFGNALSEYINTINGFDMESILKKIKNFNTNIIHKDNDKKQLILKIKDYDASKNLGSQSWCISYNEHYYNNYTEDNARQYFIYDFNKDFDNNFSLIGITLDKKGEFKEAYDKHDNPISIENNAVKNLIKIINKKDYKAINKKKP